MKTAKATNNTIKSTLTGFLIILIILSSSPMHAHAANLDLFFNDDEHYAGHNHNYEHDYNHNNQGLPARPPLRCDILPYITKAPQHKISQHHIAP